MTRTIKLTIEYDGTSFRGWQKQPKNQRTVQGEIEQALVAIFQSRHKITGSGRTDTGVHAEGQVAHFKTTKLMPVEDIGRALNANLPEDISIINAEEADEDFHAQYSAKAKTYRYRILNRKTRSALHRHNCLLYPYALNLTLMRKEAQDLIGRKDFKSFQASDPTRKDQSTVRTITRLDIKRKGDIIEITIESNGFLYKMVRNIVGTLLKIGNKRLPPGSIRTILTNKDRTTAGETAKAHGLTLVQVNY